MKKSVFFSALAFVVLSASAVFAQNASTNAASSTPAASTNPASPNGDKMEKWKAAFEQLNLTDAQKAQIKQIRTNTQPGRERRQQIMAVLTPDQKSKLMTMVKDARASQATPQ